MRVLSGFTIILLVVIAGALVAEEPTHIGASKCKMCHKTEFASWSEMAHAKAFDLLKPEEQSDAKCLACHATGGSAELPGVQCEACHGPGSAYKSIKVMKDPAAAAAAGLLTPDKATCESCHTKAPHDLPAFDYDVAKESGIHAFKEQS